MTVGRVELDGSDKPSGATELSTCKPCWGRCGTTGRSLTHEWGNAVVEFTKESGIALVDSVDTGGIEVNAVRP